MLSKPLDEKMQGREGTRKEREKERKRSFDGEQQCSSDEEGNSHRRIFVGTRLQSVHEEPTGREGEGNRRYDKIRGKAI